MDLESFLEDERERYLAAFRTFLERQHEKHAKGASELKFELGGADQVFAGVYCADFVNTEEGAEIIEFQPERPPPGDFEPFQTEFGYMDLRLENFAWDKVQIECQPPVLTAAALADWFEQWFDPYGRRLDRSSEFSGCIHCAVVVEGRLVLDLGTAPIDALWTLFELLEAEGAEKVMIS